MNRPQHLVVAVFVLALPACDRVNADSDLSQNAEAIQVAPAVQAASPDMASSQPGDAPRTTSSLTSKQSADTQELPYGCVRCAAGYTFRRAWPDFPTCENNGAWYLKTNCGSRGGYWYCGSACGVWNLCDRCN
jgi:hypothetical protein